MARFHLNIFTDVDVSDEEGIELPDLAAAKADAVGGARALMAELLIKGVTIHLEDRIEVADEFGKVLAVIEYREVLLIADRRIARD